MWRINKSKKRKMIVTSALGAKKNIPMRYAAGAHLITHSQLQQPNRKRLTRFERFLFAEAANRITSRKFEREFLNGAEPVSCVLERNREGQDRYLVVYNRYNNYYAEALTSKHVFHKCPAELREVKYKPW